MDRILETKPNIQVHCFLKDPTAVEVERGVEGMHIPGTMSYRCEMSNPHARLADMRSLRSTLVNSLRQGDNAYVHCISGISRAPMAAAVMCSLLMKISFKESQKIIDSVRNVSFNKGEERMKGAWIDCVIREGVTPIEVPTGFSCCTAKRTNVLVHATTLANGATVPICRWKKGAVTEPQNFKGNTMTVDSIEKASNQFGGRFCGNCRQLVKASLKLQIDELFGEAA